MSSCRQTGPGHGAVDLVILRHFLERNRTRRTACQASSPLPSSPSCVHRPTVAISTAEPLQPSTAGHVHPHAAQHTFTNTDASRLQKLAFSTAGDRWRQPVGMSLAGAGTAHCATFGPRREGTRGPALSAKDPTSPPAICSLRRRRLRGTSASRRAGRAPGACPPSACGACLVLPAFVRPANLPRPPLALFQYLDLYATQRMV